MSDQFQAFPSALDSPGFDGAVVTPSDSTDMANTSRGLYIGSTCTVALITAGGTTLTFQNVQAGSILPIRAKRILATGTTATANSILALF